MLDDFLEEMVKRDEAKDREIALLRRKVQRFKFKVFELETALSAVGHKKTQKKTKRYTRKK